MYRALASPRVVRPAAALLRTQAPIHTQGSSYGPAAAAATAALVSTRTPTATGNTSWRRLLAAGAGTTAAVRSSGGGSVAHAEAGPNASANADIVLYQYEVCPFCNKVRAYLDYHGIAYRVVEVDPLKKKELSELDSDYKKVPIAVINGQQVNGSGAIIAALSGDEPAMESRWVRWVDDELIRLLTPNIYRTPSEALQTFGYIADNAKFTFLQRISIRYFGAGAMFMVARKKKKQYNIVDERKEMAQALQDWCDAVGERKFLGGDKPDLADLCVYGVMRAIEEFDTFEEMTSTNPNFANWYQRTKLAVGDTARVTPIEPGTACA